MQIVVTANELIIRKGFEMKKLMFVLLLSLVSSSALAADHVCLKIIDITIAGFSEDAQTAQMAVPCAGGSSLFRQGQSHVAVKGEIPAEDGNGTVTMLYQIDTGLNITWESSGRLLISSADIVATHKLRQSDGTVSEVPEIVERTLSLPNPLTDLGTVPFGSKTISWVIRRDELI